MILVRDVASAFFLVLAAVSALLSAIGVLRSKNNFAALHCSASAAVLVPIFALIAVVIRIPAGQSTIQMLVVAAILLAGAPITSHLIGIAEYRRKPR